MTGRNSNSAPTPRSAAALLLTHAVRPPAPAPSLLGTKPPMLVLMHGVGSNERSMQRMADALDPRLLVLNVRSPLELGLDAFGFFHVTFTTTGPVIDRAEAEAGWKLVASFIDTAVTAYGADPSQVYLAGFSQGGIIALATLLTAPEKVAGAVVMSGRLLPEVLPHAASAQRLRDKPLLIVHGTSDQTLNIALARWARDQLASFPLSLTYQELDMGHTMSRESMNFVSTWISGRLDAR